MLFMRNLYDIPVFRGFRLALTSARDHFKIRQSTNALKPGDSSAEVQYVCPILVLLNLLSPCPGINS